MKGVLLRIDHPDFVKNEDRQIESFIEGLQETINTSPLGVVRPSVASGGDHALFFCPYELGVRRAYQAVVAVMLGASMGAVDANEAEEDPFPPYSFKVTLDVAWPGAPAHTHVH